eukprot:TRINITY_DN478_c0_g1_i2.p1 TRINITY_DN478_c0_g1~~TRINITY_DN478_c0_g1_i2.p1  ORF type:complete len:364 (+),score=58.32 TRINITY_DN478_c0_g1_i2:84-1094(+)
MGAAVLLAAALLLQAAGSAPYRTVRYRPSAFATLAQARAANSSRRRFPTLATIARSPDRPPPGCAFPISFVHMTKCGGTGMLMTLSLCCNKQMLRWYTPPWEQWGVPVARHMFHGSALEFRHIVGPAIWAKTYSFALVRNPWARHVSQFLYSSTEVCRPRLDDRKRNRLIQKCAEKWLMPQHSKYITMPIEELGPREFRQWVGEQYKAWPPGSPVENRFSVEGDRGLNGMFPTLRKATQWSWIADEHGKLMIKDYFKLENLKEDWPLLQRRICGLRNVSYAAHSKRGRGRCAGRANWCNTTGKLVKRNYREFYDARTKAIIDEIMADDIKYLRYQF